MSTSKHHVERLTRLLKDRVVREEGGEWGATEMGGSVIFTLFGKRGVWSCGPDGCDGKGFLLSVQGYSKRRPLPASSKGALEEDKRNPSPPKAWIRLTPAPDNSTDVDFYADKEFESLVSALVDPVQAENTFVSPSCKARSSNTRKRRPRRETEEKATLFAEVLKQHPGYDQGNVARAADELYFQRYGGKRQKWTEDDVRNAFRAMGWNWKEMKESAQCNR